MKFFFGKKGDILDIAIGKPKKAISKEIGNDVVVRIDPETKEVVGFTILNFEKRFERRGTSETLTITAVLSRSATRLRLKDKREPQINTDERR